MVNRTGWGQRITKENKMQVGQLWVTEPYMSTELEREYQIGKNTIRVQIADGVAISVADRLIPLIATKQIQFQQDRFRQEFEELDVSQPISIGKNSFGEEGYEIFLPGRRILEFKEEKGQVIVTGIARYDI